MLYTIVYAGMADLHQERLARPGLFQSDTLTRVLVGTGVTEGDRVEALEAREEFQRGLDEVFEQVDVLLTPTLPVDVPPARTDDDVLASPGGWPSSARRGRCTPARRWRSRPAGTRSPACRSGCSSPPPVGGEDLLLDAGAWFQQRTAWHTVRPPCAVD